ncbi:hypothetical protein N658DRAFT_522844 [Parathielavia hyrcaniae]|uniref:Uncharacterized protein n=1 Tax=Parathielavia hyrcaniae TaxID=113614 RepID=A0AAN6Q6V1_9PEZI|nr:hypothetical protein N658DRAFT_522844 [Parathielavia hyrcaniae]
MKWVRLFYEGNDERMVKIQRRFVAYFDAHHPAVEPAARSCSPEQVPGFGDSFYDAPVAGDDEIGSVVPNKNGFTHTVIRAWQQDLHLKIRLDDVWLAILNQFSFFVNGNAETLRDIFVAHEGRAEVVVDARPNTIETVDVGFVAQELASMVKQRLKDPNIATTLLPKFTTTTPHDQTTAAIVFLGAVKEYFGYGARLGCSFPSVTLLGERSDWAYMLQRLAWFSTIDHEESVAWALRLTKTLEYMVASFDRPDDPDMKQFWMRAVHEAGSGGSGGAGQALQ